MAFRGIFQSLSLGILIGLGGIMMAQAQETVIPLWSGVAPGSENWTQQEKEYLNPGREKMVRNVVRPTLTAFLPDRTRANGTAVIVCPGGGFRFLSWQSEGTQVAEWLRDRGIAAFVLKYRLVDTGATEAEFQKKVAALFQAINRLTQEAAPRTPLGNDPDTTTLLPLCAEDGRQAVKVVRQRAAEWGLQPDKIGMLGFSAGAYITTEVALHHDATSLPNFAAPIYGPPFGDITVPADAPPLFILCASDDPIALQSPRLYRAWKEAKKSAELHIYARGGHGFGMRKQGLPIDHWIERFGEWLASQGFLKPKQGSP